MKIIKTIYEYRYQSSEIISFLKNKIFKVFWRHNTAKDTQAYYEINREISDSLDDMLDILGAEFKVSREMVNELSEERLEHFVKERLSNLISYELFNNAKIVVICSSDLQGNFVYKVSIPFLKRELETEEYE